MGHVGLTPQAVNAIGGYRVQGRGADGAARAGRCRAPWPRPAPSPWCWRRSPRRWRGAITEAIADPDHRHRRLGRLRRPDPGDRRHARACSPTSARSSCAATPSSATPAEAAIAAYADGRARAALSRAGARLRRRPEPSMPVPIVRTLRRPARRAVAGWKRARRASRRGADHGRAARGPPEPGPRRAGGRRPGDRDALRQPEAVQQRRRSRRLSRAPRTADAAKLAPLGVDLLYAPDADEMYPDGLRHHGLGRGRQRRALRRLPARPFRRGGDRGRQAPAPDRRRRRASSARRTSSSCRWCAGWRAISTSPVEIVGCPTVREADGLALSSRNRACRPPTAPSAPALAAALPTAAAAHRRRRGAWSRPSPRRGRRSSPPASSGRVSGAARARPTSRRSPPDRPARLLAAAWLGEVRLIDNVPVG